VKRVISFRLRLRSKSYFIHYSFIMVSTKERAFLSFDDALSRLVDKGTRGRRKDPLRGEDKGSTANLTTDEVTRR